MNYFKNENVELPYQYLDRLFSPKETKSKLEVFFKKKEKIRNKMSTLAHTLSVDEILLLSPEAKIFYHEICKGTPVRDLQDMGIVYKYQTIYRNEIRNILKGITCEI
jgi:hypothetical protein